jgi:hypothetical protein
VVVVACCSSCVEDFQKVILLLERWNVHTRERGYAQVQNAAQCFCSLALPCDSRAKRYNDRMTAPAKTRDSSKSRPAPRRVDSGKPQFLTDENGVKTAVVLPLETWERIAPFLQNDLERALVSEPVNEDVPPRIAKKLRAHAKGKKDEMLTLEEFKTEVERLRKS